MDNKRYYWIKLKHSFYESNEAIDFLLTQPDGHGAEYVVLYQMLCLKTANNDGALYSQMGEVIVPYDVGKITRDCKYFERDIVTNALGHYKKLGLVYEEKDSGYLVISDIENMIGSETDSAERKRRQRNRGKAGQCHNNVTPNVPKSVTTDIEIDIDKELEIEKESEIDIEIDINKEQAASNAHAHAREEPPPAKANKAKEEFFKAFPSVRLNGANDSDIDYEKLLTAFREGNDYLQNTKSMNYITAHYAEIIGGGYRRADKPATQQEPAKKKNAFQLWQELMSAISKAKEKRFCKALGAEVEIHALASSEMYGTEYNRNELKAIFNSLADEIKSLYDKSGFLSLCEMDDDALKYERARFLKEFQ